MLAGAAGLGEGDKVAWPMTTRPCKALPPTGTRRVRAARGGPGVMAEATSQGAGRSGAASPATRSPTPHPTGPAPRCRCGRPHLKPLAGEADEEWCRGGAERAVYAGRRDTRSMQCQRR